MDSDTGWVHQLNWVDLGALIILVFFLVMGMIRGFVWQVMQVVKLVGGILLANLFADTVGGWVSQLIKVQAPFSTYLAYLLVFVTFAIAVSIVCKLAEKSLEKLKLKSYDRLSGGALGLVSGWLLISVVVILLYSYPPLDSTRLDISTSYSGAYAARTALLGRGMLPADIRQLFERVINPTTVDRLADETRDTRLRLPSGSQPPPPGGTMPPPDEGSSPPK